MNCVQSRTTSFMTIPASLMTEFWKLPVISIFFISLFLFFFSNIKVIKTFSISISLLKRPTLSIPFVCFRIFVFVLVFLSILFGLEMEEIFFSFMSWHFLIFFLYFYSVIFLHFFFSPLQDDLRTWQKAKFQKRPMTAFDTWLVAWQPHRLFNNNGGQF